MCVSCFSRLLLLIQGKRQLGDIETRKVTTTYKLGTGLEHQQVGNVWSAPDTIVSLSFSGCLNVFDRRSGENKPVKVLYVRGWGSPLPNRSNGALTILIVAGSSEGRHGCRYLDDRVRIVFRRIG